MSEDSQVTGTQSSEEREGVGGREGGRVLPRLFSEMAVSSSLRSCSAAFVGRVSAAPEARNPPFCRRVSPGTGAGSTRPAAAAADVRAASLRSLKLTHGTL